MSAIQELIKRGHLKTCGSNRATDCDDDCRDLRDEAAVELAALERVAETEKAVIEIPVRVAQVVQENFPDAPTLARAIELWLEMMATPETEG